MTEDFYDLLEVPTDASQEEIKGAFREQVRVYHPDHNDDDRARAQFTAVKKAYEILGDPVERQAYDRLGHRDYVAKRTSGIPSPEVWATGDSERSTGTTAGSTDRRGSSGSTDRRGSSGSTDRRGSSGSTDRNGSAESAASATGARSASTGAASSGTTVGSGRATTGPDRSSARATGHTGGSSGSRAATGSAAPSAGSPTGGSGTAGGPGAGRKHSTPGWLADNPLARRWRDWNPASALLWLPTLAYLAGLVGFALENGDGLRELVTALSATGGEPAALQEVLAGGRYGIESPLAFVTGTGPVDQPIEQTEFYAALGGLVALTLVAVVLARVAWREDTFGAIGRTETVVVAAAVGLAAGLAGGPLLAGIVLMPALFAVVIHWTRRLPGWSPSYAYVAAVGAPAMALGAAAVGYASLAGDLVAFFLLPVVGAVGLPLRVAIRRRFGR